MKKKKEKKGTRKNVELLSEENAYRIHENKEGNKKAKVFRKTDAKPINQPTTLIRLSKSISLFYENLTCGIHNKDGCNQDIYLKITQGLDVLHH